MQVEARDNVLERARQDTISFVKERPILSGLMLGVPATAVAIVTVMLSTDTWDLGYRIALAAGAGLGGVLLILACIFVVKLVTGPRHQLEDQVADLQEQVDEHRDQIALLTQDQLGDSDRFVPVYLDLRASVRDARARIDIAIETGTLWDRSVTFNSGPWEKNKNELASHPFAKDDGVYGPCGEAFEHLRRLGLTGLFRRGGRRVKPGDNLDGARDALEAADGCLTTVIEKAQPDQPG